MYNNEGDAFTPSSLPFRREDIYAELVSPKQLGVDHSSVTIQITKARTPRPRSMRLEASYVGGPARSSTTSRSGDGGALRAASAR